MIALIAGQGQLPPLLVGALEQAGTPHLVCALYGQAPDLGDVQLFRLEQLGTFIADLSAQGVTQICFAGAVRRPDIDMSAIDSATMPLVPKIAAALAKGDDGTLRIAIGLFEDAGFAVISAPDILPDLLPQAGVPTTQTPSPRDEKDILRAIDVHAAMASVDVGQACIVASGQAIGIETLQGTDWMMNSLRDAANLPKGGVLFKAPKAGQNMRIDLPTIGPDTVDLAASIGLNGIAIGANTQVLNLPEVLARLDAAGMFLSVAP